MEDITIKVDGKEFDVKVEETEEGKILVHCNGDIYEVDATYNKKASIFNRAKKQDLKEKGKAAITAPLPGIIFDIKVNKGDKVKEGQQLIKLIAMKIENDITATKSGTIKEIKVKKNAKVNKDDILAIIE
jgi:glutaconyl-CoA/methylmalonyl-CoA decarboxylase subunit gamma